MATGALSLLEATKSSSDMLKRGVVETIIRESPLMEMLPWQSFAGNALKQTVEDTVANVMFRPVNGTYTRSYGTDTERYWGVSILGGEYAVDNFLVDVTGTEEDLEAKQIAKLSKGNAMRFDWEFLNGTGGNNGFKGLKALLAEGLGLELLNAAGGAQISLDKLDEANDLNRGQGSFDAMLTVKAVRRQITRKARTDVSGVSLIDVGTNQFGKQVTSWNDIPILTLGDTIDPNGNIVPALDFTEDPGDGAFDTTSLWFVKFGEEDVCGLVGKGGSLAVRSFGEQQAAPQRMGRLEWYPGVAVFNRYSVVRLKGITV